MPNCIKCKADLRPGALFCDICGKKQGPQERKHRKRANGSGTIYKMPGNRAKPWAAARNGIFLGSSKTYAGAQKLLERTTDADINDKYNLTFSQIYELWKPVHAREVTVSQMGCYATAYRQCTELHSVKFRSLRKSDFQAVILKLEAANKSKSTCEKVLQLFGQLSKWAIDEEIIQTNHSKNVTTTAQQKSTRKPFLDDHIKAMQNSQNPAAKIALILIGTGARPNELFTVPLENCHEYYFIGGSKTAAGRNRVIPVGPVGLEAYQNLRRKAMADHCKYLIDAYEGNRVTSNYTKRDFKSLMVELELEDMTTYNCRHTFITMAVTAGISQAQLMQIVGHIDAKTTDRYTHMDASALVGAVSSVGKSLAVTSKLQARSQI